MTNLLHLALFSFDPELGESDVAEMSAQVHSWPVAIGGFSQLVFGPAISMERSKGHQFTLAAVVDGLEGLAHYVEHPLHQRFAAWVRAHGGSVLAIDTLLDARAVVHPAAS